MRPDVLVGPSDYSIAHDSTKSLLVPSSSSSSTDGDCKSKHSLPLPAPSVLSGLFGGGSRTVGELDAPALDLQVSLSLKFKEIFQYTVCWHLVSRGVLH